jgi:transcriptional regulator with XRE-family HTH domain
MDRDADAQRLKRLYEERVPEGMSQGDFGKRFEIGNQSMVSQYLSGHRPLNYDAAAKFAKGLRCTIADISPEMAKRIRLEIFPVLGRVSVKAAIALALFIPPYAADKAEASFNIIFDRVHIALRWLRIFLRMRALPNTAIKNP